MAAGTKLDVVSLAAVMAIGGSTCCHSSAGKAKLHNVLSKSESLVSPSGRSQEADQKPSRLICSRVENQKIFRVCFAIVCWIVLSLRSDGATTSTRNCSRPKIFSNVPEIARCKYKLVFLLQTFRDSVPKSTSINAGLTSVGVSISK